MFSCCALFPSHIVAVIGLTAAMCAFFFKMKYRFKN